MYYIFTSAKIQQAEHSSKLKSIIFIGKSLIQTDMLPTYTYIYIVTNFTTTKHISFNLFFILPNKYYFCTIKYKITN